MQPLEQARADLLDALAERGLLTAPDYEWLARAVRELPPFEALDEIWCSDKPDPDGDLLLALFFKAKAA